MKFFLRIAITLFLGGGAIFYLAQNKDQLTPLTSLAISDMVAITSTLLLFFIATGITFQLLVGLFSIRLRFSEMIGLTLLTNLVNYISPGRPGAAAKAMYLKGEKNLPYAHFTSVLAANGLLVLLISGISGTIALTYLWIEQDKIPFELVLVCISITLIPLIIFTLKPLKLKNKGKIRDTINRAFKGFEQIKTRKLALFYISLSIVAQHILSAVLMLITYQALGVELSLGGALLIGVFTAISNLFTITPNNLGIQEVVIAYLATVIGADFSTGLLGAGLIRAAHMLIAFSLTPIFTHIMLKKSQLSFSDMMPYGRNKKKVA